MNGNGAAQEEDVAKPVAAKSDEPTEPPSAGHRVAMLFLGYSWAADVWFGVGIAVAFTAAACSILVVPGYVT